MTIETVDQLYRSPAVALAVEEMLRPACGDVIFPPTYAAENKGEKSGYNISPTKTGTVCTIDSVGSQGNRMEALFMTEEYRHLVPQITVKAGETLEANLLEMGHRVADAAIRFSDLHDRITEAFKTCQSQGNATEIAKIGPTSLVFGVWDSRETHLKIPRLVNATIRAYDVDVLTRSAQYVPTFEYQEVGLTEKDQKSAAEVGLAHVPSVNTHGGVLVHGAIVRQAQLNLNALRALRGKPPEETERLQRYVLGLALIALLAPRVHDLRQGCLLVSNQAHPTTVNAILADGSTQEVKLPFESIKTFANQAAETFQIGESLTGTFSLEATKAAFKQKKSG